MLSSGGIVQFTVRRIVIVRLLVDAHNGHVKLLGKTLNANIAGGGSNQ